MRRSISLLVGQTIAFLAAFREPMSQKYPVQIPFRIAGFGYLVSFFLFASSPKETISAYVFLLGIGVSLLIVGLTYGYYSWVLDGDDFKDWYIDQMIYGKKWAKEVYGPFELNLWLFRLLASPICCIVGIAISSFTLYRIVMLLLS